jgi:hypothetical protein
MVDYEPSPDPQEQTTKELSAEEERKKLRELLGSSDEEEQGEVCEEQTKAPSQPRTSDRLRSPSRARSPPRSPQESKANYRSPPRTRSRSRSRERRARGRSRSVDRKDSDWNPNRYDQQGLINSNHNDEYEELIASIHRRINHWPWLIYWTQTKQWRGQRAPAHRNSYKLYDCSALRHAAEVSHPSVRRRADATADDKEFLSLFLEYRFLKGKKAKNNPTLVSACQAWNTFVGNYVIDPELWRKRLEDARTDYAHTLPGMRLEIHRLCVESRLPCMVVQGRCEVCGPNDPRMPDDIMSSDRERLILSPNHIRLESEIPTVLWNLYERYDTAFARRQTTDVFDRNRTQGQERPRGGSCAAPMNHGRADSLSSEQGMFAADPFALECGDRGGPPRSTESRHSRREVAAAAGERRTREKHLASVSESSFHSDSYLEPRSHRNQSTDDDDKRVVDERLARLERTVEGLLDLDLRVTDYHREYKLLLGELQRAGVRLQRFDRDKVEADLRKT